MPYLKHLPAAAPAALLLVLAASARGDYVRFHYNPAVAAGTSLKASADGGAAEWRPWRFSMWRASYRCQPQATHMVTYRHPCTSQPITLPISFPDGTPRIAYGSNLIIYYFTGYSIRVEFLSDGSADVVYNSGFFRPLLPSNN